MSRSIQLSLACAITLIASQLQAATITTLNLGNYHSSGVGGFGSVASDPVTGKYYSRSGYGPGYGSGAVTVYNTAADFQSNTPSGTLTLQSGGPYGTYFAVNNGNLLGRPLGVPGGFGWPADARGSRWNLGTGNITATTLFPGMGGVNGSHTFDWGGFSGVNWMQDQTGLYVLGKNLVGSDWQLNQMDSNLNVLQTQTFTLADDPGFGFMINGSLFLGPYFDNNITHRFDTSTGNLMAINDVLDVAGSVYWNNASYDPVDDALYLSNADNGNVYLVANASQQFGVPAIVPEPASIAIWSALGGIGLLTARRRRKRLAKT